MSIVASIMTGVAAWLAFAFLITGAFYCFRYQRAQAREDFFETQRCVPTLNFLPCMHAAMQLCGFLVCSWFKQAFLSRYEVCAELATAAAHWQAARFWTFWPTRTTQAPFLPGPLGLLPARRRGDTRACRSGLHCCL